MALTINKTIRLLNKLKSSVNEKFVNAKVKGTGDRAPRPGYYFIRSISYEAVEPFGEVCIGNVNWKQNADGLFVEELIFPIALSNLSSAKPEETLGFKTEEDLIDKVIYIFNPQIVQKNFNGEEKNVVRCLWQLVHQTPDFITKDNALLYSLSSGKRIKGMTLGEVADKLTEVEETEGIYGNNYEVYIEDTAWQNDDFTEDTNDANDDWDANDEASDEPNENN